MHKCTREICGRGTARIKSPECRVSIETGRSLCLLFMLSRTFAELGSRSSHPETSTCPVPQFPYLQGA